MKVGTVLYRAGNNILPDSNFFLVYDATDVARFDLIILHGGDDISPSLYKQKNVHATAGDKPTPRDRQELEIVTEALRLGVPIFGICRGAQLLCAVAGGTLWQHVDGHNKDGHDIITSDGQIMYSNSCHHQAMRLDSKAILLAQTSSRLSDNRWGDSSEGIISDEPEIEAAWWPELNAVGVQGHPEWMGQAPFVKYSRSLIGEYLNV